MTIEIIPWKQGMTPEAGKCYSGMPITVYHDFKEWYGSSSLKNTQRSVEYFLQELEAKNKYSLALEKGNAFHTGMESLINHQTLDLYDINVKPCYTKTILTKDWWKIKNDSPEKFVLPVDHLKDARIMADNLYRECRKADFLTDAYSELSLFWVDPKTGLQLKTRPDALQIEERICSDFKSATSHKEKDFARQTADLGYHFSAGMCIEGIMRVLGIEILQYDLVVCVNTKPFEKEVFGLDFNSIEEGHAQFRKALKDISTHDPERKLQRKQISLPRWAFRLTEPWN